MPPSRFPSPFPSSSALFAPCEAQALLDDGEEGARAGAERDSPALLFKFMASFDEGEPEPGVLEASVGGSEEEAETEEGKLEEGKAGGQTPAAAVATSIADMATAVASSAENVRESAAAAAAQRGRGVTVLRSDRFSAAEEEEGAWQAVQGRKGSGSSSSQSSGAGGSLSVRGSGGRAGGGRGGGGGGALRDREGGRVEDGSSDHVGHNPESGSRSGRGSEAPKRAGRGWR